MFQILTIIGIFNLQFSTSAFAADVSGRVSITSKVGEIVDFCDNSVVFMEPIANRKLEIGVINDQKMVAKGKQFKPGVLPVVKGTKVFFPNDDTIIHNVFSLSKAKKFDLGLYKKGEGKGVVFDKSGLVKIYCNIHSKMTGVILVLENKLFDKVDKSCAYTIKDVPDGDYKISAWYRYGKGKEQAIKINKASQTADFQLVHTKNLNSKHKNKFGKSYNDKY